MKTVKITMPPMHKIFVILSFLLILIPAFILPVYSSDYRELHRLPVIKAGVFDLSQVAFDHEKMIYLNGEWEFYPSEWIVSESALVGGQIIKIPTSWNVNAAGTAFNDTFGYGSYRLLLKNCPVDKNYICYIPEIAAAYRVYMNGELVSFSGKADKTRAETVFSPDIIKNNVYQTMTPQTEIVIEVAARYYPVINNTPILIDSTYDYTRSNVSGMFSSMYIGICIILLLGYLLVIIIGNRAPHSMSLLGVLAIIFYLVSGRGQIAVNIRTLFPFMEQQNGFSVSALLITLLAYFMFRYVHKILHIKMDQPKNFLAVAATAVSLVGCCLLPVSIFGPYRMLFLVIGFVPAMITFVVLYEAIRAEREYAALLGIGYAVLCSGLIAEGYGFLGLYLFWDTFYLPFCTLLFVGFIVIVYVKKNLKAQQAAEQIQQEKLEMSLVKLKLQETESALMLSQIKPHFLYNALLAIYDLNTVNTADAGEAILKFARYLRTNMRSVGSKERIMIEEEMQHVKNYTDIEQLRFRERLSVSFDIACTDFKVPPLTIQPLVENAIRHGICKQIDGGHVLVRTDQNSEYFLVIIEDDGIGFDPNVSIKDQQDSMGLMNVQERLRILLNAVLTIESEKGTGTRVTVSIPKYNVD